MTNKEAIKLIQEIEEDGRNVNADHIKALALAIKALEDIEEWNKLRLICASEGIIVYKVKENDNADSN